MLKDRFGCDHEIQRMTETQKSWYHSNIELQKKQHINLVVLPPWNKLDIKGSDSYWRRDEACTLKILPIFYDDEETFEDMKSRISKWINNQTQGEIDAGELLHRDANVNVRADDLRFWKPE